MITRRIAALGFMLCITAGVAACSGAASRVGPESSPSGMARQALASSVGAMATTSYAVSLTTSRYRASGAVDPVKGDVDLSARGTRAGEPIAVEEVSIGTESWAKINMGDSGEAIGIAPTKWLRLDPLDLTAGSLPFDQTDLGDAFNMHAVLGGVTDVQRTDNEHYTGHIDLAGVRVNSMIPAGNTLGPSASDLPFTAATDAEGRLTRLTVGAGGSTTFDFGISDYGAAARVVRPDDIDVIKAPATAYPLLSLR